MSNVPAAIKKTQEIKNFLATQFRPIVDDYKTRDYNSDMWLKTAMMCIMESDELQKCLASPQGQLSLVHALRFAAGTGLSLNPQEGKAALVAYGGKVEYQVMKNGMIELAMASGKVEFITSDVVYENDTFELEKTMKGDTYRFRPALRNRGAVLGYFAALAMKDKTVHVKYIDAENMQEHKKRYGKGVTNQASAWNKSFDGMALKTVLKALLRGISISQEMDGAVGADDRYESGGYEDIEVEAETRGASAEDVAAELEPEQESEPEPKAPTPPAERTSKDLW